MQSSRREKSSKSITIWFSHLLVMRGSVLVCFLFSILIFNLPAEGASDIESARSVVKITAKSPDDKVSHATGFVWQQPTQVVTALHAVAGSEKVTVYSEAQKKLSAAQIIRVHKESDLALLQLERDIGLTPLNAESVDPNSLQEYYIWGYPHNVNTMQGDHIRFSRSLNQEQPTLKSILKVSDEMKNQLEQQGFPSIDVKIIRVSSTIQPGHSGAPIFSLGGMVVGVGDGGLRGGVARINWAIPAAEYLPKLSDSRDEIPGQTSLQANLYSAAENTPVDPTLAQRIVTSNQQTLYKVSTVRISDLLRTLPPMSDWEGYSLEDGLEDFEEDEGYDFTDALVDIYDNPETGISLAVPAGMIVTAQHDVFVFSWKNLPIQTFLKISKSGRMETAMLQAQTFSKVFNEAEQWEEDPDYEDTKEVSPDDENWWYFTFSRLKTDADDEVIGQLTETWEIKHGSFVGASIVEDVSDSTEEQERISSLMLFCLWNLVKFSVQ
jgi:hypothetical protein